MLSVAQAFDSIVHQVHAREPVELQLNDCQGLVLADDVVSDMDSPPFHKALMDGYAIRTSDLSASPSGPLTVIEEVMAGQVPTLPVEAGQAIRIMTGAPMPDGADAVIQVERTSFDDASSQVTLDGEAVRSGAAVLPRGASIRNGDCVIPAGRILRAQELGALAELGRHSVNVRPALRIGVLATGDELVPIDQTPGPGQIRNSNETMLLAQIRNAGAIPVPLGIAKDDRTHLRERILAGLECDMLILSGGVSAGKLDLVPSELTAAGVAQVFHKVNIKPGKPVWFGGRPADDTRPQTWVFGLPGNPVSSMVCFEVFVRTAMRRLMGIDPARPKMAKAVLKQEHIARGDRPTYHLSRLEQSADGTAETTPIAWQGSADLAATVRANSLTLFPAGSQQWNVGQLVDVLDWSAINQ